MFAELADGARSIRSHLVAGYTVMFTYWILFADRLPDKASLGQPEASVVELYDNLSSAGQAALWTFLALMLGAFLSRVALDRVVDWTLRNGPNWDEYITAAKMEARKYEEHTAHERTNSAGKSVNIGGENLNVPSAAWSVHLADEIRDRQRKSSETKFRAMLGLCLLLPAICLIARAWFSPWWLATLLPTIAIFLDLTLIQHPVNLAIYEKTRASIADEVARHDYEVRKLRKDVEAREANGEGLGNLSDRLERQVEKHRAAEARLMQLKKPRPLTQWRIFKR